MRARILGRALRVAVARAGAPSGLRFTRRQLYYELCRTLRPVPRRLRRPGFTVSAPVAYPDFRTALDRYGPIPDLLTSEPVGPRRAGEHTPEPDLFDYGLPRLLICESDDVARMLRANGVPMESACPVYGAGELPLDPRIPDMLSMVDRSAVFVLHDATPDGLTFPARLRELTRIPDDVRVVPLGLRPRQASALHLTHLSGPGAAVAVAAELDPSERLWFDRGRTAEVEAVRPASLLRTVHRLVREVRPRDTSIHLRRVRASGFLTWPTV
ncbi:hypothetical protein IT779_34875 [Nocardia sp. NEAU-351]|uniref:Uncharacterized protein n=1 Tax=Nocardia bovistercoris TaxID=2785916 RepID=A0A931IGS9_9NOCA|nr:hypothetical protein [Nocardia bovistercoris]MBH0781467.1 hypothetical protein [Nocardia bovistercoris]